MLLCNEGDGKAAFGLCSFGSVLDETERLPGGERVE